MSDLSTHPAMPQTTVTSPMIAASLRRYIRYWYSYRTAVALLIAVVLSGLMFWLYTQQLACDAGSQGCYVNVSVHPEDRFAAQYDPGKPQDSVVIVGIDNESLKSSSIGRFPVPRSVYAQALRNLQKDGVTAVAFDIGFPDPSTDEGDAAFHQALVDTKVPVVLAYGASGLETGDGKAVQGGIIDQIPIRKFRCADTEGPIDGPCQQPLPNVVLASPDLLLDRDGVVRRMPLAVQPLCYDKHTCATPVIDSFGAAAYRLGQFGGDFQTAPDVQVANGAATFGTAWSTPVDASGAVLVNFSGPPGNFESYGHYVSLSKVLDGSVSADFLKDKIVLIGAYGLTGVNDQQLVTTSFGLNRTDAMAGVEIHANVVQMLNNAVPLPPNPSRFLTAEPPWVLLVLILVLSLATAVGVARVTVLRGGERRDISLFFVDIRGFTSMSESMAASDVTEVVQMYLDHLSGIIFTWDGTVDKYVGDEIMAFWNAPRQQENHALLAIRCAYDCINRAPELQQKLLAKGLPPIRWGIGINTGPAVVGNMGSRSRLQYTALGDTVNTAARFCAHAPAFQVLIGQMTYDMCRDYIAVDLVPGVQLKGKSAETFSIYKVTAIRQNTESPWVQFPSQMATQAHDSFTSQYTQQTVLAAAETGSTDLLVGEEAREMLARQPRSPN